MPANPSVKPDQPTNLDESGHPAASWRKARHELWTITFSFTAFDETHALAVAQHASRRVAKVLPAFDKNAVAVTRETAPYRNQPVFCDEDIYCALPPEHQGPCRDQTGADLDKLDFIRDGAPTFGAEL